MMSVFAVFLLIAQSAPATQSQPAVDPLRFALAAGGDVFVPPTVDSRSDDLDLFIHFHGAAKAMEREFGKTGRAGVVIAVNYNGLSSAYSKPFASTKRFDEILGEAMRELKTRGRVSRDARWNRVCVSSFSAGFGAVRELLREPSSFDRIDALVLADTVYAGYAEKEGRQIVNPEHVEPFRRFAERAVAGEKMMILSHCHLKPDGYAGTHQVADALLSSLGIQREPADEQGPGGIHVTSRAEKGRFHLFGCAGETGQDHGQHLTNLGYWLGKVDWK